jgi:hypothetical protein
LELFNVVISIPLPSKSNITGAPDEYSLLYDGEKQELDDGSVIFGKTTFTKDDGTLGEVADVALKYKTSGHKMKINTELCC